MNLSQEKKDCSNIVEIGIAKTEKEKREIYHLRYNIYAEEIGFKLVTVDHVNKLLYDDLDKWCTLFYAKVDSKIVGTVRVNVGQKEDFPSDIVETFYMERFQKYYKEDELYKFAFASKGMVYSTYRKLPIFTNLMLQVFELYCNENVHFGFGNCNFHLLPLHEHYGHRRIGKNIVEPNLGLMANFVLLPDDINYLKKLNSPFLKIAHDKRKVQNKQVVNWFQAKFPELKNTINSQLISAEKFWDILQIRLGCPPNKIISVLKGLNEDESKKFLHRCGVVVQCPKGDYIINSHHPSQELNILLAGKLSSDLQEISKIKPGQHFGENGLIMRNKHTSNVIAATDTEILVLSYHFFQKFRREFPNIAYKIISNLN